MLQKCKLYMVKSLCSLKFSSPRGFDSLLGLPENLANFIKAQRRMVLVLLSSGPGYSLLRMLPTTWEVCSLDQRREYHYTDLIQFLKHHEKDG